MTNYVNFLTLDLCWFYPSQKIILPIFNSFSIQKIKVRWFHKKPEAFINAFHMES